MAFAVKMFAISDGVLLMSLEPAGRITLHVMPTFYVYELTIGLSTFHVLPTPLQHTYVVKMMKPYSD